MSELVREWKAAGEFLATPDGNVFVRDVPAVDPDGSPALFVLHGFPTSSFDFRSVLGALSENRRVVLFDQIGFGLSDKPDRHYGIHLHADTAMAVLEHLGLDEVDLLTHDMGDSVGGELLAREAEGKLRTTIRRRVLTNGSIYLDLAHLTTGQQLLSSLPDEATGPIPADNFVAGVAGTFAGSFTPDPEDLAAHGILGENNGGLRLMARLIRYLEDRRREEDRYTGAIESHPSSLHVIWGRLDPVADVSMSDKLISRRPDATLLVLDTVGHYPMIEAPEEFVAAVLTALSAGS
ncbi:MAG: alpha/beta hydrolase [Microthrixaceae bacterium]